MNWRKYNNSNLAGIEAKTGKGYFWQHNFAAKKASSPLSLYSVFNVRNIG